MQQYSSDASCNLNTIIMQEPQCGSSAQPYTKQGAALLFVMLDYLMQSNIAT